MSQIASLKHLFLLLIVPLFCSSQVKDSPKELSRLEVYNLLADSDSLMFASKFVKSLTLSSKALQYSLQKKDNWLIALSYNTIASNHEELMEVDKALHYYNKALYYAEKSKNDTLKIWFYNNIGNVYLYSKNQVNESITYYEKSLVLAEIHKDTASLVLAKINMTWAYFQKKEYRKGIVYLDYAEKNISKMEYPDSKAYLNILLGMKYDYLKDNDKAEFYFNKAIETAKNSGYINLLSDSYEEYAKHLFDKGDFKKAYLYLDKHEDAKDSIFSIEKVKSAELIGMRIEMDESNRKLDIIEQEKGLQSESLEKSKIIVILVLFFLLVMLLLVVTLFRINKYKRDTNKTLRETNEALSIAKEKAEEASKLKTQFISTISHELRTPLYGVVGITNMLSDEHKELADSPHLNSLKFSARYLLSLVNDLLQINRIEEDKVVLVNLPFNLNDEVETVVNSLIFIADRNNNKIITEIDTDIPEYLIGDKLRLSQILMNLVSNALKFTNDGKVYLKMNLEKTVDENCFIHFEIKDTGTGISPKDLEKIFDKFVQIDRKQDDYQGAGLGLSIVKRLIELFKSSIAVESTEGEGTTFKFTIPFISDTSKVTEIINNITVDLSTNQVYRVLVVEDNKINQMVTKKIMDKNDFYSVIVDNGYAAIEILELEHFDVILMDINMPLINGFETTKLIRQKGNDIPIIALTAFSKEEVVEEALASGINDILIKPFEAIKLFQMMENLINK